MPANSPIDWTNRLVHGWVVLGRLPVESGRTLWAVSCLGCEKRSEKTGNQLTTALSREAMGRPGGCFDCAQSTRRIGTWKCRWCDRPTKPGSGHTSTQCARCLGRARRNGRDETGRPLPPKHPEMAAGQQERRRREARGFVA